MELYKKYRPKVWDDIVGQDAVVRSLRSAVLNNAVPTAYGFFGVHGTGKTSSAFVLAKALNCENLNIKNADPCNKCDTCCSIDDKTQVGVNYFSAANNGSADDIRRIVEGSKNRMPVRKQIIILDEVHNLSKAAFDALLIPLEETVRSTENPNENVNPALFILCSTEPNKIPDTIKSRIQSRDFTLVDEGTMLRHLKNIVSQEKLSVTPEMAIEACRIGKGSVRDTLTALDQVISTGQIALQNSGELIVKLSESDIPGILSVAADSIQNGSDGRRIAENLFSDMRNILLTVCGVDKKIVGSIPVENIKTVVQNFGGTHGIILVQNEIGETINRMSFGSDTRIILEIGLIHTIQKLNQFKRFQEQQKKRG